MFSGLAGVWYTVTAMSPGTRITSTLVYAGALALLAGACATAPSFQPLGDVTPLPGLERSTTVRWASPLRARPPRVLMILPVSAARDAQELAFRLDMDYEFVPFTPRAQNADEGEHVERLERALERRFDLVVLANVRLASFPAAVFDRMREEVHKGTGLLLANHRRDMPDWFQEFLSELAPVESALPITRGVPASLTPEWEGGLDFVQAGTLGAGRIVQLNYPGRGPVYHALLPELTQPERAEWAHYETYWSLVAKAALWAAQREPSQWIDRIQEEAVREGGFEELPPGMTEEEMREYLASVDSRILHSYRVYLNGPAESTYEVAAQLRQPGRQWRTQFLQAEGALDSGDESHLLAVPAVPGVFYLDAWVKHRGKTVDWHSIPATIDARPYFDNLRPVRDVVLPNDTVQLVFELLPSQRTEEGVRQCVMALRATDAYGRKVGYRTEDAPGARRTFTARLDVADLISSRLTVECLVLSKSPTRADIEEIRLVSAGGTKVPLGVRLQGVRNPFGVAIANHASQEYTLRALNEILAKAGVTTLVVPASEDAARFVPDTGQNPVFRLSRHWTPRDVDALAGEGEIPEGAPLPSTLEELVRDVRQVRIGAADGFILGGAAGFEDTYDAVRASASVQQEFRDRLWAEYGEPAVLGPQWAARFKTWDDLTLEGIQKGADEGFFEPWMRYHQHVDAVLLRLYGLAREAVRAVEPVAPVGFSMAGHRDGISPLWHGTAAVVELVAVPPDRISMARAAAYRSADAMTMLHIPGAVSSEEARWWPWYAVLNQNAGLWWNLGDGPENVLQGDATINPVFAQAIAQSNAVRAGFADLFLKAEPAEALVAVYDSRPSELLRGVNSSQPRPLDAVLEMLERLGYGSVLVSSADAPHEALDGYKCLILPGVDVLSGREIERMRAFVRGGGVVIADTIPGQYDEMGRLRENPPLSELFVPMAPPEAEAVADGDAALREEPKAHVMNQSFGEGFADVTRSLLEGVLRRAGCAEVMTVDSKQPFAGQRFRFLYGSARIYAALAAPDQPGRVKYQIGLPETDYVYDMQTGLEVRRPDRIGWRAEPGSAALFSALPYRVTAVQAVVPEKVRPGNRLNVIVDVHTQDRLPGTHLAHVRLRPLGGAPIPYYDKAVVCDAGRGETYIPLALNETPGFYKVVVRDVLTGIVSEWPVEIAVGLTEGVTTVTIEPES